MSNEGKPLQSTESKKIDAKSSGNIKLYNVDTSDKLKALKSYYYLSRNRYHLSILGRYQYFCGKETVIVEPGTLLWFNNKLPHGTVNIGDETRITFVFDIPHGQS